MVETGLLSESILASQIHQEFNFLLSVLDRTGTVLVTLE